MKKILTTTLGVLMASLLVACGGTNNGNFNSNASASPSGDSFAPTLDKNTSCNIKVIGDYSNFEALIAEFERFNQYYPNVNLSYKKIDDYSNILSTVLEGNDKPNIFFSYTWMIGNEKYDSVVSHMENLSDPKLKINLDCIRQSIINRTAKDNMLMVPVFSRTYGMLVNEDLFSKEKIDIPTTLTDLKAACASFNEKENIVSPMMGYSKDNKPSSGLMNTVAYPLFVAELAKNPEALELANSLDPSAGEYTRGALNAVKDLIDNNCINVEECDKIGDNYEKLLLRFFEGDVPMMLCNGDTVSGAKKRESKSEAYQNNKFKYAFYPIPVTEQGGYFIDSPSLEFSVNKNCENLDMTNEFMRFLIRNKELNNLASLKGLLPSTNTKSFDPVYAPFNKVAQDRIISPEVIGVKDQLAEQIRLASYEVGKNGLSVDIAVSKYGSFGKES